MIPTPAEYAMAFTRLIPGARGDMVLSKRRKESFQFEFAGQLIAASLEPTAANLFVVQCKMPSPNDG
jgi:hypothetical protein